MPLWDNAWLAGGSRFRAPTTAEGINPITNSEGLDLNDDINGYAYIEWYCFTITNIGVNTNKTSLKNKPQNKKTKKSQ